VLASPSDGDAINGHSTGRYSEPTEMNLRGRKTSDSSLRIGCVASSEVLGLKSEISNLKSGSF